MTIREALEAEAAEASSRTFEFRGTTLTVPVGDEIPLSAFRAYENGKMLAFCEEMVGPVQWAKLEKLGVTKVKDLKELSDSLVKAMGSSEGE